MKIETSPDLLPLLKQYFGFASFRPLQEEIIRDSLAGRDVFALLPTGGGKSLCFQLPALVRDGLTVVVSPLIALMKDQVDALQAGGIAATFLNSSLAPDESRKRLRGLHNGEFRLLYAAPERLMLSGFLADLQKWNVKLFAIDEAHCISEWGHDFRPEYRQIAQLRDLFPKIPFMALTATATERVREDIVAHLKLHEPQTYVASFNRPNLTYRVIPKNKPYDQLFEFLRARPKDSGIVYCQSRKTAERVAANLTEDGIPARPYHAGLAPQERAGNQELFLRDDVRVVCATIAFGMGINKPNVRFVVHYDLPKNIEGYYQETGRAGRDGLPGECILLFSPGDVVKQTQFIDEKPNPHEQKIAREQLQQMVHYAECATCRRKELLAYFGEEFSSDNRSSRREEALTKNPENNQSLLTSAPTHETNCGACDNCLSPRQTFDGTLAAQKFLSCVYRIREKNGFGVGFNHVVEVLTGADTEKIRKWNHTQLSTYGIGKEHSRPEWAAIGRELIRLGFLRQTSDKFSVLELTNDGLAILKSRQSVTLTKPVAAPETKTPRVGEIACDEVLFEHLRQLRRKLADERAVPSYIIFSDVSLRQMARNYPTNKNEFARINGVGEAKLREFSDVFLTEIELHLATNPRQIFADDSFTAPAPKPARPSVGDSARETLRRFRAGQNAEQIAAERGFVVSTVYGHLAEGIERGEPVDLGKFFTAEEQQKIAAAFERIGFGNLTGIFESLGGAVDFGRLRIFRAATNVQHVK
ncbi:MAG TPA: RecQ family ATP-dependent DNA helicase [Verrucomicrobiae bacterium]|nr:RecQ family ATP-dependent DNA helicase [Verrucomicrobiae bacterium]